MKQRQPVSIKNILKCSAAFCAFNMGAAFVSGQEVLQFFASFGFFGIGGLLFTFALMSYAGWQIQRAALIEGWEDPHEVFPYFCGPVLGSEYIGLMIVALFAETVLMAASAGAIFEEYYGVPNIVGRAFILLLGVATVLSGLEKILDVLGYLAPVVIAFLFLVSLTALLRSPMSPSEGAAIAASSDLLRGASQWTLSAIKYACYCALVAVTVFVPCGQRAHNLRESNIAAVVQMVMLTTVLFLMLFAELKNMDRIAGVQLPNLVLAAHYLPVVAKGFSVILLMGIFSATVVSLWFVVRKFSKEGTMRYRVLTVGLAALSLLVSGTMSFSRIVNLLFTIGGPFGLLFCVLIAARQIRTRKAEKRAPGRAD